MTRNFFVSYLKGVAIFSIILIHIFDWGDISLSPFFLFLKQFLFVGVVFFMITSGSVIFLAYGKYENIKKASRRLLSRAFQLVLIYYSYNILKFFLFDFSKESFYRGFENSGIFTLPGILTLKSFAVPIPILITFALFVALSPLLLLLYRRFPRQTPRVLIFLMVLLFVCNYVFPLPSNAFTNFLYARGNITFAPMLWLLPFLLGFFAAMFGFESSRKKGLFISLIFLAFSVVFGIFKNYPFNLSWSMHPLLPHAIAFSFVCLYGSIYFFQKLEQSKNKKVLFFLEILRQCGDASLFLYVAHWVVIDITILLFAPHTFLVAGTVPIFVCIWLWYKRRKVSKLYTVKNH